MQHLELASADERSKVVRAKRDLAATEDCHQFLDRNEPFHADTQKGALQGDGRNPALASHGSGEIVGASLLKT
jgi:hypothetical protein